MWVGGRAARGGRQDPPLPSEFSVLWGVDILKVERRVCERLNSGIPAASVLCPCLSIQNSDFAIITLTQSIRPSGLSNVYAYSFINFRSLYS